MASLSILLATILRWGRSQRSTQAIVFVYHDGAGSSLARVDEDGRGRETLARTNGQGSWLGSVVEEFTGFQVQALSARALPAYIQSPEWLDSAGLLAYRVADPERRCDTVDTMSLTDAESFEVICLDGIVTGEAFGWSPDGRLFAFGDQAGRRLRLVDAAGAVITSRALPGRIWGLAWSPDASRLALTLDSETSLLIIGLDGREVEISPDGPAFGKPTWSPDGRQLAVLCYFQERIDFCFSSADGAALSRIEFPLDVPYIKQSPLWSPRGDLLVFEAVQNGAFNELYLLAPDGAAVRRLTFDPLGDSQPAWSADGSQIAFISMRDGNRELYRIGVDGSGLQRLTDTPGDEYAPVWIPAD